jgi:hypothetical protein
MAEGHKLIHRDKFPIPIKCKWYRELKNGTQLFSVFESITGKYPDRIILHSVYQLSADDLGYVVVVEAVADEEDCAGTAIGKFGPITLALDTRRALDSILAQGSVSFQVTSVATEPRSAAPPTPLRLFVAAQETALFTPSTKYVKESPLAKGPTTTGSVSVVVHLKESKRFVVKFNAQRNRHNGNSD